MRHIFFAVIAALAMIAAPAGAQETRLGENGFESPPASIDELDWLIGQWTGEGIQGAPAMESWLPPSGGTMIGTFVQESQDGAIMFSEHMYIMPVGDSLALKLKHFNADLTGWEEKDDMLTFRLVAIEPCAAYFNALTLRCADPDNPGSGLVAAVRMKSDNPEPQELVFRFAPAERSGGSYDCDGTTYAINRCLAAILERADERRKEYFETAIGSADNESELAGLMRKSREGFEAYRESECASVYEQWKEGSIRNAMFLRCSIRLTDQRTHDIWRNWLTYQDSSEPLLPEPLPTR
ncbi:DUF6265 family protein [Erythrobacter sp. THAF29]|uniref:DUF6265 family protein n=1 Tax=Erythrobacter sp. THAF29 TaxID=2587851 RepID=UPI001267DA17|nr:DUF6265 family protein [Erythrobacter sp. THAF29]QFT76280.1 hypothetical protein FIU90_01870 [Erythrobacter sp. THAF29]